MTTAPPLTHPLPPQGVGHPPRGVAESRPLTETQSASDYVHVGRRTGCCWCSGESGLPSSLEEQ
jgi:hypothetical protein